jgi:hypothetical protein
MTEPSDLEGPVTPDEAEVIMAELGRARDEPPLGDAASAGCVLAMVSIIAIVLMPFAGSGFDLSSDQMLAIGVTLGVITVVGGAFGIFGGSLLSRTEARLEKRISSIESHYRDGDRSRLLAETVRLLDGAYVSRGPKTVQAFDPRETASRLGDALPYVERIEIFLVEKREINGVFTER